MDPFITGPWRQPRNTAADQKGGIHDDDTATDLGFRGGTVAGAIHMEQFPPLLVELFGEDWWRTGGMSLYFRSATVDREPVRCLAAAPVTDGPIQRCQVWMEKEDGTLVMEGTASSGPDDRSALAGRLAGLRAPGELRVFQDMRVGQKSGPQPTMIEAARVDRQLTVITEPLPLYSDTSMGGRVLPVTGVVHAVVPAERKLTEPARQPFVGLYGGIEVQHLNGPVLAETEYVVQGEILGLTDSAQTEIVWWRFEITRDAEPVAAVLKMDRIMKGSSPLWRETEGAS